jgi:hypothetical protein
MPSERRRKISAVARRLVEIGMAHHLRKQADRALAEKKPPHETAPSHADAT